jgi:UDP:flavonoid glycosyltransferase YjiC (YdhE family)
VRVVLTCSLGGGGHLEPIVGVGRQLGLGGHDVSLLVPPALELAAREQGLAVDVGLEPPPEVVASYRDRINEPGLIDRELFADHCTEAMLPAVSEVIVRERPALVLREATEYASVVASVRGGIPFGTIAISQAHIEHDVLAMVAPIIDAFDARASPAIASSPFLSSFPATLDPSPWSTTVRYRLHSDVPAALPDWWGHSTAPLVYVTFGSVVGHTGIAERVFRVALEAVEDLSARVLLTVGRSFDPERLDPLPGNVHVEGWVSQAAVLPACDVVVCHGGSGTTFGALRAGVPLVVCPLYADNARNGTAVASIGAGLVTAMPEAPSKAAPSGQPVPGDLRKAIARVLTERSFGRSARRVRDEMAEYPLADEAVRSLAWMPFD